MNQDLRHLVAAATFVSGSAALTRHPLILAMAALLWVAVVLWLCDRALTRLLQRERTREIERDWLRESIRHLSNHPEDQAWLYHHFRLAGVPAPPGIKPLPGGVSSPTDILRHHSRNGCAVPFRQCRDPEHWEGGDMPDEVRLQVDGRIMAAPRRERLRLNPPDSDR